MHMQLHAKFEWQQQNMLALYPKKTERERERESAGYCPLAENYMILLQLNQTVKQAPCSNSCIISYTIL